MQRSRLPAVLTLVLVIGLLGAGLLSLSAASQAQSSAPLLAMPDLPPTPTPAPAPSAALSAHPLLALRFDSAAALSALQFSDPAAHWQIDAASLKQAGYGPTYSFATRDTYALLEHTLPADATVSLTAYNERSAVADLVLRAGPAGFYRYRVLADSYAAPAHRIELVQPDSVTVLASVDGPGLLQYNWHTLSFSVAGDLLVAQFDGREVARARDATLLHGQAGFGSMAIGGVRFGSLEVSP